MYFNVHTYQSIDVLSIGMRVPTVLEARRGSTKKAKKKNIYLNSKSSRKDYKEQHTKIPVLEESKELQLCDGNLLQLTIGVGF